MTQRNPPHPHLVSHPLRQAIRSALKPPRLAAGVLAAGLVGLAPATLAANFPATLELSALDGTNGFALNGVNAYDLSGGSVSNAGDVNGDGLDDVLIGAYRASPSGRHYTGQSYVVFGRSGGFTSPVELSALDGTNGFALNGIGGDSGFSVSGAGDVNGDGIDDLIIGAPTAGPGGKPLAGQSYVVFGRSSGFAPVLELSALDGANGFAINGIYGSDISGDLSGRSVSGAGDVNGDGVDDLLIGAPQANPDGRYHAGQSYVVFGRSTGFGPVLELSTLDGTNGFAINGINAFDFSGHSVSGAGDVNGDGVDDLLISAHFANTDAGQSYVVFGRSTGFGPVLELSALDGTNGFAINGINAFDLSGYSVSGVGDVNGDGLDDLIIGAPRADPGGRGDAGQSYVVFGRTMGFAPVLELSALDGTNGFTLNGINEPDSSGASVSGAGDVNGDGTDDLIIGAPLANQSYVVFGRSTGFGPALELSALDGTNGFTLNGAGASVSNAGDVNGDGTDDLIIGAPTASPDGKFEAGQSYVVFGISAVPSVLTVEIDIKPDDKTNCLNIDGHGVIPVAVLGSATFEVADIDLASLSFAGLTVRHKGNGRPQCAFQNVNRDGFRDLVCHFQDDLAKWRPDDGTATLTGSLKDGTPFEGTDTFCLVPKKSRPPGS